MKIRYLNDDGEIVEGEGVVVINGVPIDDEFLQGSRFFRAVAVAEWDLIRRYDRGELWETESGRGSEK